VNFYDVRNRSVQAHPTHIEMIFAASPRAELWCRGRARGRIAVCAVPRSAQPNGNGVL
jgi:hypothetical protein